jgi:hypothetical protein
MPATAGISFICWGQACQPCPECSCIPRCRVHDRRRPASCKRRRRNGSVRLNLTADTASRPSARPAGVSTRSQSSNAVTSIRRALDQIAIVGDAYRTKAQIERDRAGEAETVRPTRYDVTCLSRVTWRGDVPRFATPTGSRGAHRRGVSACRFGRLNS